MTNATVRLTSSDAIILVGIVVGGTGASGVLLDASGDLGGSGSLTSWK